MEIQFQEKKAPGYKDLAHLSKKAQLTMESVVPDTKDDIGRILSVRPEIYLKSKDLRNHGASVTGEAVLTVIYINETETAVSFLKMTQSFSLDYELPASDDDVELQILLLSNSVQARALNPRKVSADIEISGELTVSKKTDFIIEQILPEGVWTPVHLLTEEIESVQITGICEKSFSVNEQLVFPEDAPKLREIIGKETAFRIYDKETVGSRLLIKGKVLLRLYYLPEGSDIPCVQEFSVPFSQLVDLGAEDSENAQVWIVPTSDYVEQIDTMEGQKLLDIELHALAQVRGLKRQPLRLVSDAYSNLMPCELNCADINVAESLDEKSFTLTADESIDMPEEFAELLMLCPSLGLCTAEQGSATVDLLCRATDGKLFAMRRSVKLNNDETSEALTSVVSRLSETECRLNGKQLILKLRAESSGREERQQPCRRVVSISLDEERAFDTACYPALTAVWAETESLWELAKIYHSSPEAILSLNETVDRKPIFIPKTN